MLRPLARSSLTRPVIPAAQKVLKLDNTLRAPLLHIRQSSSTPGPNCARGSGLCFCKGLRDETAERAAKLRALGAETAFPSYDPLDHRQVRLMEDWYAKGPPPLSEYRLSFGKYKGKRLEEVPDVYFVKYLIPRRDEIHSAGNDRDYIAAAALEQHLKKNPDLKSQAGNKKTVVREGGISAKPKRKKL